MNFQKMVFVAVFPLHSLTLTIFIFLLTFSASNGDDHHKYMNCSSSFISCGDLQNVGYPFWGSGRPQYCGHPALQLHCIDNKDPVLKIGDGGAEVYYLVYGIPSSSEKSQMTIRLHEYFTRACLFHSFNRVFNEIFQLGEGHKNITLFYDCPGQDMVDYLNCSISCSDKKSTTYYLSWTPQAEPSEICHTVEVPVPKNELQYIYNETCIILHHAFEVYYRNSSACSICTNSGGVCGSHDAEFACFHRKSGQWKLIVGIAIPGAFFILAALNVAFWYCIKRKSYIPLLQSCRILSVPMKQDLEVGSSFYGIPVLPYKEPLATPQFSNAIWVHLQE